jgi:hypothetical protein
MTHIHHGLQNFALWTKDQSSYLSAFSIRKPKASLAPIHFCSASPATAARSRGSLSPICPRASRCRDAAWMCIRASMGTISVSCQCEYNNVINHPFRNGVYHLFLPIYGDLKGGLLLFYPHEYDYNAVIVWLQYGIIWLYSHLSLELRKLFITPICPGNISNWVSYAEMELHSQKGS